MITANSHRSIIDSPRPGPASSHSHAALLQTLGNSWDWLHVLYLYQWSSQSIASNCSKPMSRENDKRNLRIYEESLSLQDSYLAGSPSKMSPARTAASVLNMYPYRQLWLWQSLKSTPCHTNIHQSSSIVSVCVPHCASWPRMSKTSFMFSVFQRHRKSPHQAVTQGYSYSSLHIFAPACSLSLSASEIHTGSTSSAQSAESKAGAKDIQKETVRCWICCSNLHKRLAHLPAERPMSPPHPARHRWLVLLKRNSPSNMF